MPNVEMPTPNLSNDLEQVRHMLEQRFSCDVYLSNTKLSASSFCTPGDYIVEFSDDELEKEFCERMQDLPQVYEFRVVISAGEVLTLDHIADVSQAIHKAVDEAGMRVVSPGTMVGFGLFGIQFGTSTFVVRKSAEMRDVSGRDLMELDNTWGKNLCVELAIT